MRILATSGGFLPVATSGRCSWRRGPIIEHAIHLAGDPERPRFCYLGTAGGDSLTGTTAFYSAFAGSDVRATHLELFTMPNVDDIRAHLLAQDVIWVGGGSVANLLAVWRVHARRRGAARVLGERGRPRRCLGRLDLLVRRRPDRQLRRRPAPLAARPRPAALRQRRPLRQRGAAPAAAARAGRRRATCRPRTPPTTASASSTRAPSWSRRSRTGPASPTVVAAVRRVTERGSSGAGLSRVASPGPNRRLGRCSPRWSGRSSAVAPLSRRHVS